MYFDKLFNKIDVSMNNQIIMSLNQKIRKLDIFKKVPKDLAEGSNIGGAISIITVLLILFYIFTELANFINPQTNTLISRDNLFTRQQLVINLDIQFPRYPCEIISLDLQDVMMSHSANIGSVKKYRLSKEGKYMDKGDFELLREPDQAKQLKMAETAFLSQYGCRLVGQFTVKEVPGNFHISSHAYQNIYARLMMSEKIKTVDVSHKINYLYFGYYSDLQELHQAHKETEVNRLNDHERLYSMADTVHSYTSHYHLDIVPTSYRSVLGNPRFSYQYTWNHNTFQVNHMPALYFNYHIGGVKVEYVPKRGVFFTFLLNLCAVIGGIYALANFINNTLQTFTTPSGYQLIQ